MDSVRGTAMSDFEAADETITTDELDEIVSGMALAKAEYESAKQGSDILYKQYQELRAKCIATLQQAGKSKYFVDGVGTISVTEKLKIQTIKNPEDKEQFFDWLKSKYGNEGYLTYATVNYQSLNSLYNSEFENAKLDGTADNFQIPGVGNPEHEYGLSFRK